MEANTSVPLTTIRTTSPPSFLSKWGSTIGMIVTLVSLALLFPGLFSPDFSSPMQLGLSITGGVGLLIVFVVTFLRSDYGSSLYESSAVGGNWPTIALVLVVTILGFVLVFVPAFRSGAPIDPNLAALIGVLSSIAIGGFLMFLYTKSSQIQAANVISRMVLILISFFPYALITFGPLVDIITQKLQYTPASIVGISSIFINWIISTTLNKGEPVKSKNIFCEIPGLAIFSSNIAPQPMMATLSMIAYIATYASRSTLSGGVKDAKISFTNDPNKIWPLWVLYGLVAGAYASSYYFGSEGCVSGATAFGGMLFPALYGGIFGILGFEFLAPRYDAGSPGASSSHLMLGGSGSTTPSVGTCAAGSSDGEFICESFENGKLKRTVITE